MPAWQAAFVLRRPAVRSALARLRLAALRPALRLGRSRLLVCGLLSRICRSLSSPLLSAENGIERTGQRSQLGHLLFAERGVGVDAAGHCSHAGAIGRRGRAIFAEGHSDIGLRPRHRAGWVETILQTALAARRLTARAAKTVSNDPVSACSAAICSRPRAVLVSMLRDSRQSGAIRWRGGAVSWQTRR